MQPSLEERASLVMGLARGGLRLEEIVARYDATRELVALWVQEFVTAAPECFDSAMLATLRGLGFARPEVHPRQSGRIQEVPPLDVLQSLGMYRSSGHVLFFHPHGVSQVWFEGDELIDAHSGTLTGAAAVYRIAGHDAGDFLVDVTGTTQIRTINVPTSALLLESARRLDEGTRLAESMPSAGTVLEAEPPPPGDDAIDEVGARVLALFRGGATLGEALERSDVGELETRAAAVALLQAKRLRSTGVTRRPEVPTVERRVHALRHADADVSSQISQKILRSASNPALPPITGRHKLPTVAPSPAPRSRFDRKTTLIAAAAGAGVLLLVLVGVLASGDDPEPSRPSAASTTMAAAAADAAARPEPPCPDEMVLLPAAELQVGREAGVPDASPVHHVIVPALCIDRHEVTTAQYRACVDQGGCESTLPPPEDSDGETKPSPPRPQCNEGTGRDEHPINCVSWSQADAYCRHHGKRLPTEAQWERAARGTEGRRFPWGNGPPNSDRLNACGPECTKGVPAYGQADAHPTTAPVGAYPDGVSPDGVHDLAGNVREWTSDGFVRYQGGVHEDPQVPATDGRRVVRGGGFTTSDRVELDVAYRRKAAEDARDPDLGIRCVMAPRSAP